MNTHAPPNLMIQISEDDLRRIVADAVREEIDRNRPAQWMSVSEYVEHSGRSKSTVYRYIDAGELRTRDVCGKLQIRVD